MPNEPTWDDILRPQPSKDASGPESAAASALPAESATPAPATPRAADPVPAAPVSQQRAAQEPITHAPAPEQLPPPKTRRELREREAAALATSSIPVSPAPPVPPQSPTAAPPTPSTPAATVPPVTPPTRTAAPPPVSDAVAAEAIPPAEPVQARSSEPAAAGPLATRQTPGVPAASAMSEVGDADVLAGLFVAEGSGGSGTPPTGNGLPPKERRRGRFAWLWVLLFLIVIVGAGAGYVWLNFEDQVRSVMGWELPNDYEGSGNGTAVNVTITSGQIGADVAKTLEKQGVTRTFDAFYDLLLSQATPANFQPGTYELQKHMSAKSALAELLKPDNRIVSKVTIPEGSTLPQTLSRLAKGTGVSLKDLKAEAKKYTQFGVPKAAPGLEGFLFPATYQFDPGLSATDMLQRMVDRMNQSLDDAGVKKADRLKVLTLAALVQKEGGSTDDFYKVARVFQNRLDTKMLLQSDATVSYGSGGTSISTTDAERADADNPYNTYVHLGLPVGPIAAPGDDAIDAALHPTKGKWLYFVLINGETGETKFSNTLAEHDAAVLVWQAWLRAHPDFDK